MVEIPKSAHRTVPHRYTLNGYKISIIQARGAAMISPHAYAKYYYLENLRGKRVEETSASQNCFWIDIYQVKNRSSRTFKVYPHLHLYACICYTHTYAPFTGQNLRVKEDTLVCLLSLGCLT